METCWVAVCLEHASVKVPTRVEPRHKRSMQGRRHCQCRGWNRRYHSLRSSLTISLQHRVCHFLDNKGMPSVRSIMSRRRFVGSGLLPTIRSIIALASRSVRRLSMRLVTYGRPAHGAWSSGLRSRAEGHACYVCGRCSGRKLRALSDQPSARPQRSSAEVWQHHFIHSHRAREATWQLNEAGPDSPLCRF
jgi:hypothetical protein